MAQQKKNRRDFLKSFGRASGMTLAALSASREGSAGFVSPAPGSVPVPAQALDTVRVGLIGVGARGGSHLKRLLRLEGVEVKAICDISEPRVQEHLEYCAEQGHAPPASYARGEHDYRRMLEEEELDITIISTPWRWHAVQAVDTMESGRHAFVEVPAAITVEECWQLVDTAEKTGRHCMMMENVCYGREELMVLNMCRQALFGDLLHGEGAYIHDLREQLKDLDESEGTWRPQHHSKRNGNLYPTHGLGPIAQYMGINRGDRFDYLTSMSSPALGRALYARENFPPDHLRNQATYIAGDMNTTLIRTVKGRSIVVQHDTTTPRPYTRHNLIQGTRGVFAGYPNRIVVEGRGETHAWQDVEPYREEFEHPLWKRMGEEAARVGGHGGMDFLMLWRTVYCLRNGEPLDQDVYDAASWSVIAPLSEESVASKSRSVDVPDFTRGTWRSKTPLGIVS